METEIGQAPEPASVPALRLRAMTAGDLEASHRLSRGEKWPHRQDDWDYMLAMGEGIVAELDGQIAGTIMIWCHDDRTATLGMVIVSPDCRGMGVGRKLMQAAIERAGSRAIKLNATQDGLALYESLGFVATGAVLQHQGTAVPVPIVELAPGERIRPMGLADAATIIAFDRGATGMTRERLIGDLLDNSRCIVLDRDGEAAGFAIFRRFGHGNSIAPAVAPDSRGAKALIAYWLSLHPGMFVRLDIPETSGLSSWLEDNGMMNVGRVITMVRGEWPETDAPETSFAIVSQALG